MSKATPTAPAMDRVIDLFRQAGYARAEAALLHPADLFLELSGEDIRRRLYITQDAEGRDLCLRPEFTIPLCVDAVAEAKASGRPLQRDMSYAGKVFRQRTGETGEFLQAGIESLGRADREAADADMLMLALSACKALGVAAPAIRIGDAGMLAALLEALAAPAAFRRRLVRRLASGKPVEDALAAQVESQGLERYSGVMAALDGAGPEAASAFVSDMLSLSGVRAAGGRSATEIAERFLAKAKAGSSDLAVEKREILARFLNISGDPDHVLAQTSALAMRHGLDRSTPVRDALATFERRIGFLAAGGIPLERLDASTAFVRSLDYYTGMVFEILNPAAPASRPLAGGGRYDRLLQRLGSSAPVPAVGFSLWLERFPEAAQ
jgi:ATP phosphoribosyltransferase regulatory subunit